MSGNGMVRPRREQQTATSEVLQVISSPPGELDPVFESMPATATKLCQLRRDVAERWRCLPDRRAPWRCPQATPSNGGRNVVSSGPGKSPWSAQLELGGRFRGGRPRSRAGPSCCERVEQRMARIGLLRRDARASRRWPPLVFPNAAIRARLVAIGGRP